MTISVSNTAVLLFIRNEKEEAKRKKLAPRRDKLANRRVIREFNRHAVRIAQQTDLPVFVCQGKEQRGSTFGEKLANATEDIFQKGYQKVITIGNDCLSLTVADLIDTKEKLRTNDLVLGPSSDGGVYLIGLNKTAYERADFLQLRWESAFLFHDFCASTPADSVCILDIKTDVDDATTFRQAFQQLAAKHILKRRLGDLFVKKSPCLYFDQYNNFSSFLHYSQIYFRGPPQ